MGGPCCFRMAEEGAQPQELGVMQLVLKYQLLFNNEVFLLTSL